MADLLRKQIEASLDDLEGRVPEYEDLTPPKVVTRRPNVRPHEVAEIMARYKRLRSHQWGILDACARIAEQMGMQQDTVYRITKRLAPTTDLASDILKANAAKLAMRVVRKANVDQAVDILSRSNVGVLASDKGSSGPSGPQFFIGVSVDSLGAVKVGVQSTGPAIAPPSEVPEAPTAVPSPLPPARPQLPKPEPDVYRPPFVEGRTKATREAMAKAQQKQEKRDSNRARRELKERAKQLREEALKRTP